MSIRVSVLVAARNEELLLPTCLQALAEQRFPTTDFEVLIGEDNSTDRTPAIARAFAQEYPHFFCLSARPEERGLRAKANVLAQLIEKARGEYLLITDADTCVPPRWIQEMTADLPETVGMRTGFTLPKGSSLFARLQTLDWLAALTVNHVLAQQGTPLAAMGNNMLVRRAAYQEVGGYARIGFSLTEDVALFQAIRQAGWQYQSHDGRELLARTRAETNWPALVEQRRRWIRGALQLGGKGALGGILICLQLPILIGLSWLFPAFTLLYALLLWGASVMLLAKQKRRFRLKIPEGVLFLYPFYGVLTYFLFFVLYLLRPRLRWRGRSY